MPQTKTHIAQLRNQKHQLKRFRSADSLAEWFDQTREVVLAVFKAHTELSVVHGSVWAEKDRAQLNFENRTEYENSLDGMIRTLNRVDEVTFFKNPIVVLTLAGILFMLLVAGSTFLYFTFFL